MLCVVRIEWGWGVCVRWSLETQQLLDYTSLCRVSRASQPWTHLTSRVQASPVLPFAPAVLQPAPGFASSEEDPRTGMPSLWLDRLTPPGGVTCTRVISLFLWVSSRDTDPDLTAFLFYVCVLLTAWVAQESAASFQSVFRENFSTCGCIFDVFTGRGGLPVPLLHHLVLSLDRM